MQNAKQIAARIKKYRSNSLTQEELAEAIDYTAQHIGQIERGLHMPDTAFFVKAAALFHLPVDIFLSDYYDGVEKEQELSELVNKFKNLDEDVADSMIEAFTALLIRQNEGN